MDNHADTSCARKITTTLYYSGQVCNAMPYSEKYEPLKDIPNGGVAMAWTDQTTRLTFVLESHQVRHMGHMICDGYMDAYRGVQIDLMDSEAQIPMDIEGTIDGFNTKMPTSD
eukprot:9842844-Ditylum_brightwellii.AAC.1